MTTGERLYEAERRAAAKRGELLPTWCELPGDLRLGWVQRGATQDAAVAATSGGLAGPAFDSETRCRRR